MACLPCLKARRAAAAAAAAAVKGDGEKLRKAAVEFKDATAEKLESLRIREIMKR